MLIRDHSRPNATTILDCLLRDVSAYECKLWGCPQPCGQGHDEAAMMDRVASELFVCEVSLAWLKWLGSIQGGKLLNHGLGSRFFDPASLTASLLVRQVTLRFFEDLLVFVGILGHRAFA